MNEIPSHNHNTLKFGDLIIYDSYRHNGTLDYSFLAKVIDLNGKGEIFVDDMIDLIDSQSAFNNNYNLTSYNYIVQNFGNITVDDYLEMYPKTYYYKLENTELIEKF